MRFDTGRSRRAHRRPARAAGSDDPRPVPPAVPRARLARNEDSVCKSDGAARPVVQRAGGWFAPAKMSPELAEEATIDAAMSRQPPLPFR